jgi:multiple sugar transport system substrate-binding protein
MTTSPRRPVRPVRASRPLSRRRFLAGAGGAGTALGIAACGGDDDPEAGGSGGGSGEATFVLWGQDAEQSVFQELADAFEAETGSRIALEVLPFDQVRTVVDRRLQAGDPPDLFRVTYTDVGAYASTGALADLSGSFGDGFGDDFLPALWGAVLLDDRPFGVPHHTDTSALVYNAAHVEAAGITDLPASLDDAWTWEEFVDSLRRLREADLGAEPFAFNYQLFGAYRWFNTLYQAGGRVLEDDLATVALGTDEARRALEWTRGLYTDGLHAANVLVQRPTYPDEIFPSQQISMIQAGSFLVPFLDETIGDGFEWGVTYLPRDAEAAAELGGNAVVVTRDAPNPEVAAQFAQFLVTADNMRLFCERTGALPVRTDLVDAELAYEVRPDLMPVFVEQATTLPEDLVAVSTSPGFTGINQALIDAMDGYLSDPSSSTDALVERLTADIEQAVGT